MTKKIISGSSEETVKIGSRLGRLLSRGDVVALKGDLGSGKTTLVKGMAHGAGVKDAKHVNSPSFVILKEYSGKIPIYHFDVYRLDDPSSMDTVGYKEFFYGEGASVIEWADKIEELLPEERMDIEMTVSGASERELNVTALGKRYENLLRRLRA
jgi:tRNA threonylcarbamoyladenosine biosynthesis protein TsaE